ncbi:MAG: hypothetical protein A3F68_08120 [Acidobacteria bacterium RIFCSPLOWO2_12_FULL_54_10]|nr:MAG: hypothetical protein A3F68_08120 [Acidobacteria bacterium RIFCSPLOWO2_12_FULL_54_10]
MQPRRVRQQPLKRDPQVHLAEDVLIVEGVERFVILTNGFVRRGDEAARGHCISVSTGNVSTEMVYGNRQKRRVQRYVR